MRLRLQGRLLVALVSMFALFGCANPGKQPPQQPVARDLSSHDCSGTKKSKSAPYREAIRPDDRADHEMVQAIRVHLISSKDPSFDGSEQTVYAHQDEYGGSGSQTGYFL